MPLIAACATVGCERQETVIPERRPRPVTVKLLTKQQPPHGSLVSASVGSWKTEQIGFEVGGRVEMVAEPNTEIEGRVHDESGTLIVEGTPVARIDDERYRLQVDKAKADVTRAEQNLAAAQTELNESIPAQIAAAVATRNLAKTEYERSQRLFAQNAGSQGDVDRDKANYESAISQVKQLEAATKAQQAQIESLHNAVLQAKQSQRDVERNLEDCTLYSSFRGQIADIFVVPGSVVNAGQSVATIQMMDPIKIELEVSAEDSRRLQQRGRLPVNVTMPDGTTETHDGYLYLIDPVADPLTRTFTLTLLVMNKKLASAASQQVVATTDEWWRLDFKFLPGIQDGMLFVEERALLHDEDGPYLWKIENATIHTGVPADRMFKVSKMHVRLGSMKVPYLGNWVFQQVLIDGDVFDPSTNVVVGRLVVSEGTPLEWNGDTVLFDTGGQWMLRPGDLVRVDLSGDEQTAGYFVAMDAIVREGNQSYLFVVEESGDNEIATRIPIRVVDESQVKATSALRQVAAAGDASLEGVRYVTRGTHYLIDGEAVKAVDATVATR